MSMAGKERDSHANPDSGREEDDEFPGDPSASVNGEVGKGFLNTFRNDGDEEPAPLEPEKTEKYVVTDPKTGQGHRGVFKYVWDVFRDQDRWGQSCEISKRVKETVQPHETWQARISVLLLKILWCWTGPLQALGHGLEDMLNLFSANDGFFSTLYRALFQRGKLVFRQRNSEDYMSIIGALDPRFELYKDKSSSSDDVNENIFPGTNSGSRVIADVLVLASKLAYENAACVKKVVTETWKMNFVGFYNCWNEFQKQRSTQVFLFTDKPKNAKAIVVAFRGTELFNAIDWSTDFDFSWFEVKGLGKVHVGWMEALGLGDRKRIETFVNMYGNASSQQTTDHGGSAMSGLPADVVADEEKLLAYDDITKKVKELIAQNPEAKLFVTGHSLGGALANLYTTLLFFNKEEEVTSRLAALYTFGQPRVGGPEYCDFMESHVQESKYWRIVYSNDIVPRVPFDDSIFQFSHSGYCYYYNERYVEITMPKAPNSNYFSISIKTIIMVRLVALYELVLSLFSGWIYGPEFKENYSSTIVRCLGLIFPGVAAHVMNNYVNAIRLGPSPLEAKLHELEQLEVRSKSLFSFISSFMGKKNVPATTRDYHED